FSVDPASGDLKVGSSDLAVKPSNWCTSRQGAPCYVITATATQSGVYNSPFTDEIVIYVVDPASSPPSLSLSKTMAMPGDVVSVTVANDPNPSGTDCVALASTNGRDHDNASGTRGNWGFSEFGLSWTTVVGHGGSYNFTIPN